MPTGRRRPITMADVASSANVSVTTVSHVLNRTRKVAPHTEQAVLRAVAATGYVPDDVVRSMRTVGTRMVGLALSLSLNPSFTELVLSIERSLTFSGYSLLLTDTHDDPETELRAISDLLARNVDGVILAPSAQPERALSYCAQRNIPVAVVDRMLPSRDIDQVGSENIEATASLVDHLARSGHRKVAMISGKPGLTTSTERTTGYRLGLKRNGLRFARKYLISGDSTESGGFQALQQLLALPDPPTAVVSGNNQMTIGVMGAARSAGITIPADLALIGYDDFAWADFFSPRLSVLAQPIDAIGDQAVRMLLDRIADPDTPHRTVSLRPQFVHRDSCGCADHSEPTEHTAAS
ncbi:LacI family DNA-binding transcriptional regulator [Pseudonocardia sp. CA-107938]|uniref:LacI family DNA-binding transcriptional regulator n=1 Tax=Pseudonocardia sp. CA-107938 TaxID=3240021 RepID=UPI003D93F1D3